ncbi:MAG TPA: FAD-dependent oxidoreductase [Gammaproteobacteria bacterium]|nr:FAD-dependent oxidoreductase [Gammaproteobacteria bacterium]
MNIAVVGAGVSGLVCALGLGRHHNVTVFETANRAGGHAHTVAVHDGRSGIAIDTGFIVFNFANYPLLSALFDALGVRSQPSDMSFSVRCDVTGFEFSGSNLNTFFAQRGNLLRAESWRLLKDILRFNRDGIKSFEAGLGDQITVGDFARQHGYSDVLVDRYLLPLGGALWSCDTRTFRNFPMRFVLEFLSNHAMLQIGNRPIWRTVTGGSRHYVEQIARALGSRLCLNRPVSQVLRAGQGVKLLFGGGDSQIFDEVVLATHADTSLALVAEAEEEERELLSAFPYQDNEVCLHTDTRVLPRTQRAWASWNYRMKEGMRSGTCVTYNMNKLQALDSAKTFCVSLNQREDLRLDTILHKETVRHPLFVPGRDEAQARHTQMIRRRGLSYCGAYWGFGFHEDGVRSATQVCDAFNVERPF